MTERGSLRVTGSVSVTLTVRAKVIAADGEQEARRLALSRSKSGGACVLQRSAALHNTM